MDSNRDQPKGRKNFIRKLVDERRRIKNRSKQISEEHKSLISSRIVSIRSIRDDTKQANELNFAELKAELQANAILLNEDSNYGGNLLWEEEERKFSRQMKSVQNKSRESLRKALEEEFSEMFEALPTNEKKGIWRSKILFDYYIQGQFILQSPENSRTFVYLHVIDKAANYESIQLEIPLILKNNRVRGCCISKDGKFVAIYSHDAIEVYDVFNSRHIQSLQTKRLKHMEFIGDSYQLFAVHYTYGTIISPNISTRIQDFRDTVPKARRDDNTVVGSVLAQICGEKLFLKSLKNKDKEQKIRLSKILDRTCLKTKIIPTPSNNGVFVVSLSPTSLKPYITRLLFDPVDCSIISSEKLVIIGESNLRLGLPCEFHLSTESWGDKCRLILWTTTRIVNYVIGGMTATQVLVDQDLSNNESKKNYVGILQFPDSVFRILHHDEKTGLYKFFPFGMRDIDNREIENNELTRSFENGKKYLSAMGEPFGGQIFLPNSNRLYLIPKSTMVEEIVQQMLYDLGDTGLPTQMTSRDETNREIIFEFELD
jgi:hypothetical protein